MKTLIAMCLLATVVLGMAGKAQAEVDYDVSRNVALICDGTPEFTYQCTQLARNTMRAIAADSRIQGKCEVLRSMGELNADQKAICDASDARYVGVRSFLGE